MINRQYIYLLVALLSVATTALIFRLLSKIGVAWENGSAGQPAAGAPRPAAEQPPAGQPPAGQPAAEPVKED
jgi:hypothetical protein